MTTTTTKPAANRVTLHQVKLGALVTREDDAQALVRVFGSDERLLAFVTESINWDALTPAPAAPRESRADRKAARQAVRDDYAANLARYMDQAEAATRGVFLNKKGQERNIDPTTLVCTTAERVTRWASDEFTEYLTANPFPTFATWQQLSSRNS